MDLLNQRKQQLRNLRLKTERRYSLREPVKATACKNMTDFSRNQDCEHTPVMLTEVIEFLQCRPGGVYVDATLGLGGHAQSILKEIQPDGLLIGIDRDQESIEKASARLEPFKNNLRVVHDNYKNLALILNNLKVQPLDGILADLGVS